MPRFAPTITTQVAAKYVTGGPFVDDVSFGGTIDDWPRAADGTYLPVTATAEVYRTDDQPHAEQTALSQAPHEHVGSLGAHDGCGRSGRPGPTA